MANHPNRSKRMPLWRVEGDGPNGPITIKIRAKDRGAACDYAVGRSILAHTVIMLEEGKINAKT